MKKEELIIDLLMTYAYFCNDIAINENQIIKFIYKGRIYNILHTDYRKVCNIIDIIKGVKYEKRYSTIQSK